MTAIVEIDLNNPQARKYLQYTRTLPFATVIEKKKQTFEEAAKECNAVTVDVFVDEVKRQIHEHFAKPDA